RGQRHRRPAGPGQPLDVGSGVLGPVLLRQRQHREQLAVGGAQPQQRPLHRQQRPVGEQRVVIHLPAPARRGGRHRGQRRVGGRGRGPSGGGRGPGARPRGGERPPPPGGGGGGGGGRGGPRGPRLAPPPAGGGGGGPGD